MDSAEFEALAEPVRQRSATAVASYGFPLIEGRGATLDEVTDLEHQIGVVLPEQYKTFMMRYGGGTFGFVELFPITCHPEDALQDLGSLNREEFPDRSFVAVAPVGTGDHWGFPLTDGRCHDEVWFHVHDGGATELDATDFLEFVARQRLRS